MSAILNQLAVRLLRGVILGYRLLISPFFPPSCRFAPTCSEYALEAIETHGAIRGTYLAARRLLRCHPIKMLGGSSGFDPVPPKSGIKTSNCSCEHAKPDAQHRHPNVTDDLRAFHKGI